MKYTIALSSEQTLAFEDMQFYTDIHTLELTINVQNKMQAKAIEKLIKKVLNTACMRKHIAPNASNAVVD